MNQSSGSFEGDIEFVIPTYVEANPDASVDELQSYLNLFEGQISQHKESFEKRPKEEQDLMRPGIERYIERRKRDIEAIKIELGKRGLN